MILARTTKSYTINGKFGSFTLAMVNHYHDSYTSPVSNGNLLLRPQAYQLKHQTMSDWYCSPGFPGQAATATSWPTANWDADLADWTALKNEAIRRFTKKARGGKASLGITLATYNQSRDMIVDRSQKLYRFFTEAERRVSRMPAHRRRYALYRGRAGDVLEGFFGWAPLVSDIQQSLEVMTQPISDGWLSGRAKTQILRDVKASTGTGPNIVDQRRRIAGVAYLTLNGRVVVSNPNVYLANRLGLLDLPGVAWDLVPWSFVVNMFTNMGAIVSSFTDFVGIQTFDMNTTRTSVVQMSDFLTYRSKYGFNYSNTSHKMKQRYAETSVPAPRFQLRTPSLDLSLGAIALSLVVQRIGKIDRLLSSAFGQDQKRVAPLVRDGRIKYWPGQAATF